MSAPLFLVDEARLRDDPIVLDGDEGRHAAVVRRIRIGERVDLGDGAGQVARCVVSDASRSGLVCRVESRYAEPPPSPRLVVVQALPKGDRALAAVEMLTEVGADVIVPWTAARCVVRWSGERADKALARWRSTAREAAKQSRRAWVPEVTDPASTDRVATVLGSAELSVVLHEAAERPLASLAVPTGGDVVLVVGPEGGIDDRELAGFADAGAQPVRLGSSVLRTSTAGVAAAAALLSRTPRWA
ncbi:MAG: 16S rRNA (uracil(1498)-N(3))-methyltransferase [Propionibacteriales bacterium]|nr:16S rRNA (uracil(1498)-N(3))-methyltransferase [Propionibacteriales bacterium]